MDRERLRHALTHAVLTFAMLLSGLNVLAMLVRGLLVRRIAPSRHEEAAAVLGIVAGLLSLLTACGVFWWEYHRDRPQD